MNRPALVVDGLSVFHSVAGPAAFLTNGYTYSFVVQLTSAVKKFGPEGIFVCWDRDSHKRRELHPQYKAQRESSMNEDKHKMLVDVQRFLTTVGATQLHAEGHEADDIGAFLANTLQSAILVSNDKDWLQLVRPGISVFTRCRVAGKKQEKKLVTVDNFAEITGWSNPEELVLGLCAMGDSVDNINGLQGVGELTVKKFFMGLSGSQVDGRLREFFAGDPLFLRNKQLIDLRHIRNIPGLVAGVGEFHEPSVKSLLEELTFASMLKNFPEWVKPYKEASANLSPIS
jgi:5'-3' exonuclease